MRSFVDLYLAAAVAAGLIGGYAFFGLWRRIVPSAWSSGVLAALPGNVQGMLTSQDPSDMLAYYKAVMLSLGAYAVRNTLGLAVGLLPMTGLFLALTVYDPSGALATRSEAYPASALPSGPGGAWTRDGERLLIDRRDVGSAAVRIAGESLDGAKLGDKLAICPSTLSCLLLDTMLFETHSAPPRQRLRSSILVRPLLFDANPFWPYLNDLDFLFFLAAALGSAAGAWAARRRGSAAG